MPEIETWLRWQGHRRCLGKLLTGLNDGEKPTLINTDKAPACSAALAEAVPDVSEQLEREAA